MPSFELGLGCGCCEAACASQVIPDGARAGSYSEEDTSLPDEYSYSFSGLIFTWTTAASPLAMSVRTGASTTSALPSLAFTGGGYWLSDIRYRDQPAVNQCIYDTSGGFAMAVANTTPRWSRYLVICDNQTLGGWSGYRLWYDREADAAALTPVANSVKRINGSTTYGSCFVEGPFYDFNKARYRIPFHSYRASPLELEWLEAYPANAFGDTYVQQLVMT